jgi:hypothetical protein
LDRVAESEGVTRSTAARLTIERGLEK